MTLIPGTAPHSLSEDALKQYVADELERVRQRSFGLTTTVLDEDELLAQHSRLMSPLVWDLAHVGNYEELWLLRAAAGIEAMRPELDSIYDAFEHPRAARPQLPMLRPDEAGDYIGLVRRKVLGA
ncbi:MAG: DinB family protein, partial [Nocardioidaceae bacterium]